MGRLNAPRGLPRRGVLLLVLAAAIPWLHWSAGAAAGVGAEVTLGPTDSDSDFLYVQPADGISTILLRDALEQLGFEVDPDQRLEGARVRVGTADARSLAARLAGTHLARSVEGDAVVRATQLAGDVSTPPNDALYGLQQDYLAAIGAPAAWAREHGGSGEGVLIAVVDTGIDYNHNELIPRLAINFNDEFFDGRDNDRSGCPDDIVGCNFVSLSTADPSCGYTAAPPNWRTLDDEGHGTFVAGVAAATGDNEVGITGVAPRASLLPVKVLDCTATGRISDAAAGIRYAADMHADVINISFGTPNDSPALREAIEYAQARGAIVVASAGNDGSRGITYPAAYPGVISVAASGVATAEGGPLEYRRAAAFARFGLGIDYLAPGVDLVSTIPERLCGTNQWDCVEPGYARGTGSSFATPVVAGAIAVMLSTYPHQSTDFVLGLLQNTRRERLPDQLSHLIDLGAAATREIVTAGAPGTSRDAGGGAPPGPAAP